MDFRKVLQFDYKYINKILITIFDNYEKDNVIYEPKPLHSYYSSLLDKDSPSEQPLHRITKRE